MHFERVRRDGGPMDAFVEADAPDAFVRGLDAGSMDAGPIPQCEGVPPPEMPCASNETCAAEGRGRCALPIVGACPPCGALIRECVVDGDCVPGEDSGPSDAGTDASPGDVGPVPLVCVTYDRGCTCERRVCEPRCTGPTCPNAQCDRDGYVCPRNSICAPSEAVTDDHGCAPRRCTTSDDCECGYCAPEGLCANGAGTCVI